MPAGLRGCHSNEAGKHALAFEFAWGLVVRAAWRCEPPLYCATPNAEHKRGIALSEARAFELLAYGALPLWDGQHHSFPPRREGGFEGGDTSIDPLDDCSTLRGFGRCTLSE